MTNRAAQLKASWQIWDQRLKHAKEMELKFRMQIAIELFEDAQLGVNTKHGLKLTMSENITLDKDESLVIESLRKAKLNCPDFKDQLASLLDYKPELDKRAYRSLPDNVKLEIADIVTVKPSLPSLKVA